jgi:hypothetical protein
MRAMYGAAWLFVVKEMKKVDQATADILNKALDLAKQGVVAAIETVKQYAPQVWAMARRQTQLNGIECFILAGLGLAMFVTASFSWRWAVRKDKLGGIDSAYVVLPVFGSLAGAISFVCFLINGIDLTFNPDYWTMMKILDLMKQH